MCCSSKNIFITSNIFLHLVLFFMMSISKSDINIKLLNYKGWPPIKIYFYNLPTDFNEELVNKTASFLFSPYNQCFQFILEVNFSNMIQKTPILTNSIEEADFVYLNFFPYYMVTSEKKFEEKMNLSKAYYSLLKKQNLLNKRLFVISTRPTYEIYFPVLIGYKGCYERLLNSGHWFVVPYLSHFPDFPPSEVDFTKNRTNNIFLMGSILPKRKKLFEVVKNISNSMIIAFRRKEVKKLANLLYNLPVYLMNSKYCIVPLGDTSSSKRFYDAVIYGSIPIVISDTFIFPFDKTQINWDNCVIKIKQKDIEKLPEIINSITEDEYQSLYTNLQIAREHIRFDNGVLPTNGVGSILWELFYTFQDNKNKESTTMKKEIKVAEQYLNLKNDKKALYKFMYDNIKKEDPQELHRHPIDFYNFQANFWAHNR